MKRVGDFHNFGQAVVLIEGANGPLYLKPRTSFWEWLFFDQNSLLRFAFEDPLTIEVDGKIFSGSFAALFNLRIENPFDTHSGVSQALIEETKSVDEDDCVQFGLLLAYCFYFGIQDLHRDNVVRINRGLQPVDAEVVLSKLLLPSETLLLPFKNTSFEKSAIGKLFSKKSDITKDKAKIIFSSFICGSQYLLDRSDKLASTIGAMVEDYNPSVRVILKDTGIYREWLRDRSSAIFIQEEKIQLERGDIPYFFKKLGHSDFFYFTNLSCHSALVECEENSRRIAARIGCNPVDTFQNFENRLPAGAMYIAQWFFEDQKAFELKSAGWNIQLNEDSISFNLQNQNFLGTRFKSNTHSL